VPLPNPKGSWIRKSGTMPQVPQVPWLTLDRL
jgi:hypothetical protein